MSPGTPLSQPAALPTACAVQVQCSAYYGGANVKFVISNSRGDYRTCGFFACATKVQDAGSGSFGAEQPADIDATVHHWFEQYRGASGTRRAIIRVRMMPFPHIDRVQRRFSIGAAQCILDDAHLWIHDRDTVARPGLEDVGGIRGFYHPPIAGGDTRISLLIDGEPLRAESYEWRPGEFVRVACRNGLEVQSSLVVVAGGAFVLTLIVGNATDGPRRLKVAWQIDPVFGVVPSDGWGWVPPKADAPWRTQETLGSGIAFVLEGRGNPCLAIEAAGFEADIESRTLGKIVDLEPQESATLHLSAVVGAPDSAIERTRCLAADPDQSAQAAREAHSKRLAGFLHAWPSLESSNSGLVDFYDRGLLSFFTCLWESDAFVLKPHMAESGIDGGAVCTYFWGIAYIAKLLAISRPDLLRAHIVQALRSDPFEHYAYTPIDGDSVGPWYAYNQFSVVWCIYQYALWTGETAFLSEQVAGRSVFEWVRANAVFLDDLSQDVHMTDFGDDHNLLELRRTDAYRHVVPSPNAERVWCLRAVDEMAGCIGLPGQGLGARAEELGRLIQDELWSEELGWFRTLDAEGRPRTCWSIQIFDMLRFGFLDAEKRAALVKHLNDGEFLSDFGVHSMSKRDRGYDPSDVDWGGPGVYAGDGPELVEDLWIAGAFEQGDDLLRPMLWRVARMPYYPQAVRADAVDYRRDGRANEVTGLKASETLVFGLLGLRVGGDGAVSVCPHLPSFVEDYAFRRVRVRGREFSVEVARDGYRLTPAGGGARFGREAEMMVL